MPISGIANFLEESGLYISQNISLEALIGLGAVAMAVLVPLAIFSVDHKTNTGFAWDKAVILTKVLNAKLLLVSLGFLTLPLIFWSGPNKLKIFIVSLYFTGLFLLVRSIVETYKWLMVAETGTEGTYRNKKRLEYLHFLKKEEDKKAIWSLTWGDAEARALIDDRTLVEEFLAHIEGIKDKSGSATTMLREFMNYMDKIQLSDPIVYEKLLGFTLTWANSLAFGKKKKEDNSPLQFSSTARRLFFNIMDRSLKDSFLTYLFYKTLIDFVNKNEEVKMSELISHIAPNFFASLEKLEEYDEVWEEFPAEWKVSAKNMRPRGSGVPLAWLNAYMRWITSRKLLTKSRDANYDFLADNVTKNLLPEVEPTMWVDLIALHWAPHPIKDGEDTMVAQVRNFIDSDKTFGAISRTMGFTASKNVEELFSGEIKHQKNEVINLNLKVIVFPSFRSVEKLSEYIRVAKSLKYTESYAKKKRDKLVGNLSLIKESLDEVDKANELKSRTPKSTR